MSPIPEPDPRAPARHVFYMPGFDPRPPETYWGLFRRESRATAATRGRTIAVGEPERAGDGFSLDWTVDSDGTLTRYSLLRWDDIVRENFPRAQWRRLGELPSRFLRLRRAGYYGRLRAEGRRFATIITGVHWIYLALGAASLAAALAVALAVPEVWRTVALVLAPLLAYALLALLTRLTRGKPFYVSHLVDDTAFTHAHAAGRAAGMAARLDAFAGRLRAAEGSVSEIVLVGHSSSSFLGAEVLDRVLSADPGFGGRATPVSFVTLGSVIPWIGLDPAAEAVRGALRRVAEARAIGWLDVRASWDWLSIHLRDPLTASGVPSPGPGRPQVLRVSIEEAVAPEALPRLKWNLFQMHFQLLMASRDPTGFDYIDFVSGPEPVHAALARRRAGFATPETVP